MSDPLTTKNKIDLCNAQAELAYHSWDDRRQYEWKFTIGVWSVLVLGVGFFSRDIKISPFLAGIFPVVGLGIYITWLRGLWTTNGFDREMQFHYLREAWAILKDSDHVVKEFPYSKKEQLDLPWKKFLFHYTQGTYILITAILLVVTSLFAAGTVGSRGDERLKAIEDATKASTQSIQADSRQLEQLTNEVRLLRELQQNQSRPEKRK